MYPYTAFPTAAPAAPKAAAPAAPTAPVTKPKPAISFNFAPTPRPKPIDPNDLGNSSPSNLGACFANIKILKINTSFILNPLSGPRSMSFKLWIR